MDKLPIEIWQQLLDIVDLLSQIRLTQVNSYLHNNLKITDFYNIGLYHFKLRDDILKNYKYIKKLEANDKISDEGIGHLDLYLLDTNYNNKISDYGIKDMTNLRILRIENKDSKITDEGIKSP